LIISFSAYGIYRHSLAVVLNAAEGEALRVGTVMVEQQSLALFSAGEADISLTPAELPRFDLQVRKFLHPFAIVKIKVFSRDGTIVYSTDRNIIGQRVEGNPRLARALNGAVDSHQETKEKLTDLADEHRFNVDVVESYQPVRNNAGEVAGCFEIYMDVTRYREDIFNRVASATLILTIILAVVFCLSFWVVRIGANQLKMLLKQLQQMALTDPLTGVFNRGAVIHRAQEELARIQRRKVTAAGNRIGVIMIDLDHFKNVNDIYGHLAGDEILREMSRRVIDCLREYDVFGRYGGEEFLAIIPDGDYEVAIAAAERIRQALLQNPFQFEQQEMIVTASFGVTVCGDADEELDTALQRADEALYQAKAEGRNRVVGRV
jgi:diguanylate cyclase (GGDEF)-like protein